MLGLNRHAHCQLMGLLGPLVISASLACAENWPGWRGPRGDGTSLEKEVPTRWSSTENVVWKTAVSGEGHSSPVVWNDRVFLTTGLPERQERALLCFDRGTGGALWQQTVIQAPLEAKNGENSYASATPVTDGEKIYVTFLDREEVVVAAYDFAGKQLWLARPGRFQSQWGFSHTPRLFEDKVIVGWAQQGAAGHQAGRRGERHRQQGCLEDVRGGALRAFTHRGGRLVSDLLLQREGGALL